MNFTESVNYFIGLLHTLVRFLPLGVYFFAYFSSAIYKDIRSAILLIGLIVKEMVASLLKPIPSVVIKLNKSEPLKFVLGENVAVFPDKLTLPLLG